MLFLLTACGVFGYGTPYEDTAVAPEETGPICQDASFFGNQPDVDHPGTLVGRVTSPSGQVPVSGAQIEVEGSDAWAISTEDGCFMLDLPAGPHRLAIEKGRYTSEAVVDLVADERLEIDDLTLDQGDLKVAVVLGKYDSVHALIDELGIDYDGFNTPDALFDDLELLNTYDAVFVNCGSTLTTANGAAYSPEQIANVRAWVHAGGTLYTSDWEWSLFEGVAPDALSFGDEVLSGPDGTLTATILDRNIVALLGSETTDIAFDLPGWALAESAGAANVLVSAEVRGQERPLAVMAFPGQGRAAFTSFHNEAQLTQGMRVVLYELILALSSDRAPAEPPAQVSGVVYQFRSHQPLGGAMVTTLQFPDVVALTDSQGRYTLEGLPIGAEVTPYTLAAEHVPSAHQTFVVDDDIPQVYVQLVHQQMFSEMAQGLGQAGLQVDLENACHVVTTVSVPEAGQLQGWGEFLEFGDAGLLEGATASISPGGGTQLYFNESVLPDPSLHETTTDGGVLWANLQPGRYVLHAEHPDHTFPEVTVDCAPGRFVNASPPWGLTALD